MQAITRTQPPQFSQLALNVVATNKEPAEAGSLVALGVLRLGGEFPRQPRVPSLHTA